MSNLVASPVVLAVTVGGIAITITSGMCTSTCSYVAQSDMNKGMAALLLTLEIIVIFLTFCTLVLSLCSCKYFGINLPDLSRPSTTVVDDCSEIDIENGNVTSHGKEHNHANGNIPSAT